MSEKAIEPIYRISTLKEKTTRRYGIDYFGTFANILYLNTVT